MTDPANDRTAGRGDDADDADDRHDGDEHIDVPRRVDLGPPEDMPCEVIVRRSTQPSLHPDTATTER